MQPLRIFPAAQHSVFGICRGIESGKLKKTHPTMHPLTLQPSPATNDFRGQNCNFRNTNFKSFPISGHPWANRTTRLSTFFASIAFRRYTAWMYEYDWVILSMYIYFQFEGCCHHRIAKCAQSSSSHRKWCFWSLCRFASKGETVGFSTKLAKL